MTDDAVAQLEQLLREEREAIRRLDGARVIAFAERKKQLLCALRDGPGGLDLPRAARLRALVPALRQNGVLLAHARDILRDALVAAGAAPKTKQPGVAPSPVRRLLSVRG